MKMKKVLLSLSISALMASNLMSPCAASSLSREELREKYAEQLQAGEGDRYPNYQYEPAAGWVDVDENGIGEDGVEYGIEFAGETVNVYNDYCFTKMWDVRTLYHHGCKEYEGIYYAVKPDQTIKLVSYDRDYFRELKPEKVELPAEIDGMTVNEIDANAFRVLGGSTGKTLREIVVPDSVTIIRHLAFENCFYPCEDNDWGRDCKINVPANIVYLGNACYSFCFFSLGEEIVLPETLEFFDPRAFANTFVKVVLPECDFVSIEGYYYTAESEVYGPDRKDSKQVRTPFGDNCIRPYPTEQVERYLSLGYDMDEIKEILNLPDIDEPLTPNEAFQAQGSETAPSLEPAKAVLRGDLDENGTVNVMDAVMMARLVGDDPELEISEAGLNNADYNNSGAVDAKDLSDIMQNLANPAK